MARKKSPSRKKPGRKKQGQPSATAALVRLHTISGSLSSNPIAGDIVITGFHNQGADGEVRVSLYSSNPKRGQTVASTNHRFEVTLAQADVPSGQYLVEAVHVESGASDSMFI